MLARALKKSRNARRISELLLIDIDSYATNAIQTEFNSKSLLLSGEKVRMRGIKSLTPYPLPEGEGEKTMPGPEGQRTFTTNFQICVVRIQSSVSNARRTRSGMNPRFTK